MSDLPNGWEWIQLEDIAMNPKNDIVDGPFGSNLKATEYLDSGIPIIRLQNIDRNIFIDKNIKFISHEKAEFLKRHSFISGDIVITKLGQPLGKACLVPDSFKEGIIVADVVRIRSDDRFIAKQYLLYALNSRVVINQLQAETKGTTRARVNLSHIRQVQVPFSPLNEQLRIVAKLDRLFANSRRTREELEHIPKLIKRYKQAVLAAAFRGDLTADWRNKKVDIDIASKFLEKILKNRRYVAENVEKQTKKSKYKEPIEFTRESPFEIPETWSWVSADQISSQITDGEHIQPPYQPEGLPMLSAKHVRDGYVEMSDLKFISKDDFEKAALRCAPKNGDILIVSVGATTGRAAIVFDCQPFVIVRSVLLLKPLIEAKFIYYWINSPFCQDWIGKASGASAQPHFYINDNRRMPVPLPPEEELREITQRVEKLFKAIDLMEEQYQKASQLCDRLEQATLAKAFRGELVPQDPNDEPASALLERILTEKQAIPNKKPTSKNSKNKQLSLGDLKS